VNQLDGYRELFRLSIRIPDWRSDLGKLHRLSEVLFIMVVALIAGAQDCEGISRFGRKNIVWLRQFLTLKHGAPRHDMYLRVLAAVPAEHLEGLVRAWSSALRAPGALTVDGQHVAFDGQSLRGSADRAAGQGPVHMVSAFLVEAGFTLGTLRVDDKSNEITAIPDLIRSLNLKGATISSDAMGCQREIAAVAREAGAHYLLQVKENQPTLLQNIKTSMAEATRRRRPGEAPAQLEKHRHVDKGHGRIETRVCALSRDLSGIEKRAEWKDLAGIASVLREREDVISGKTSREISYYILSNAQATAADVASLARNHWAIENGLHWSLDVVWGSDAHGIRDRNAAENMARLRRFCAGMVKQSVGWGMSGKGVREDCAWDPDTILRVLAGEVIALERLKVAPVKYRKAKEAAVTRKRK